MKYQDILPKKKTTGFLPLIGALLALGLSGHLAAQEPQEMQLEGEVKGQSSQPKVLFILPWEDSLQAETIDLDESLISEEDFLAPIDRTVFQEKINMYRRLESTP